MAYGLRVALVSWGTVLVVTLALSLIIIASILAFNITTKALKSSVNQLVVVGCPTAFYECTSTVNCSLSKLLITLSNPSATNICITGLIIGDTLLSIHDSVCMGPGTTCTLDFSDSIVDVRCSTKSYSRVLSNNITSINVSSNIGEGHVNIVLVTSSGALNIIVVLVKA